MECQCWPWKKQASVIVDKLAQDTKESQDIPKKQDYVQISVESYERTIELEEEVTNMNDQVTTLNEDLQALRQEVLMLSEKLSFTEHQLISKENLAKQHAKIAEEAVSGWEKAESEIKNLKDLLESVTLSKLSAASALEECRTEITNMKAEHGKILQESDKMKLDLEAKLSDSDQALSRASVENAASSKSLQQCYNTVMKISEEKSQVEAQLKLLKCDLMSRERMIGTLNYELRIASKEAELCKEDANMSLRSAEAANERHLEDVRTIAKLDGDCKMLRSVVQKKFPGASLVAKMTKAESSGRGYPDRVPPSVRKVSLDNVSEVQLLRSRLLAMEYEAKMLKEALAKRNSELQASRNICAKTASQLRSLESQMQVLSHQKNSLKSNAEILVGGFSTHNASNPPSLTSVSEDGIDEEESVAESSISELSHFKKERNVVLENTSEFGLMDDFVEVESACSDSSCPPSSVPDSRTL